MMTLTTETPEALAELVAGYVKGVAVGEVRFTVAAPKRIYLSHGYWRVPVHPSSSPELFYPMAEEIGLVEDRIREATGLKLILVIAEPIDEVREQEKTVHVDAGFGSSGSTRRRAITSGRSSRRRAMVARPVGVMPIISV